MGANEERRFHRIAWLVVIILMAASLPLSKFTMSIFQFLILVMWFFFGIDFKKICDDFKQYSIAKASICFFKYTVSLFVNNFINGFRLFFKNKVAILVFSIYIMHVLGLLWTSDFAYALKDLRIKLPLLMFPVILVMMPKFSKKQVYLILGVYVLANLSGAIATVIHFFIGDYSDARQLSVFISPVRFSLNLCFSIFIVSYFIIRKTFLSNKTRVLLLGVILFLAFTLFLLESGIGFLILALGVFLGLISFVKHSTSIKLKLAFSVLCIAFPLSLGWFLFYEYHQYSGGENIQISSLPVKTVYGNTYKHDTTMFLVENGGYPGTYFCEKELRDNWNQRSKLPYDSLDRTGGLLKFTLIRYLNSKDLHRDAQGVSNLKESDLKNIEKGIANHVYVDNPGIKARLYKFFFGLKRYQKTKDPNNSSLFQRLEYWRTASQIIKSNFWIGVGTGDVPTAFDNQYIKMKTQLKEKFRFRAHNQFLTIFLTFGVFGFLYFLFVLFYSIGKSKLFSDFFMITFLLVALVSMLTEDTIESQAGVTFFAFFFTFLLFSRKNKTELQ
ncbi:MAG: O-antigen ligase family protein [Bacteroidales bacterium]